LQNDNGWNQGQIFFTPDKVWGMPPYHAQKLSSEHHQPLLIESVMVGRRDNTLDITATRSENGKEIVLHIVNMAKETQSIDIDFGSFGKISKAEKWVIVDEENGVNTPEEPTRISAKKQDVDFLNGDCALQPYSYTVVVVKR
jgi:alpha-L-arabinofuranosidase